MISDTVWQRTTQKHKYQEPGYHNFAFKDSHPSHRQNTLSQNSQTALAKSLEIENKDQV